MFFFQFLLQAGLFFTIPLFLSVALGSQRGRDRRPAAPAVDHAAGRRGRDPAGSGPTASPRRVVRLGICALLAGHRRR